LLALAAPRPWEPSPFRLSFLFAFLVNELLFVAVYLLVASTALAIVQSGVESPVFWVAFGLAVLATVGLGLVARRALRTSPAVSARYAKASASAGGPASTLGWPLGFAAASRLRVSSSRRFPSLATMSSG
jgi:hypothetical protein